MVSTTFSGVDGPTQTPTLTFELFRPVSATLIHLFITLIWHEGSLRNPPLHPKEVTFVKLMAKTVTEISDKVLSRMTLSKRGWHGSWG